MPRQPPTNTSRVHVNTSVYTYTQHTLHTFNPTKPTNLSNIGLGSGKSVFGDYFRHAVRAYYHTVRHRERS